MGTPIAGTEVEHLVGALDRLRATFRWRLTASTRPGLLSRIGASSLTLGGLLKHLAAAEDYTLTTKLTGAPMGAPWDATGWDGSNDWEFTSAADDTSEQLYALWDGATAAPTGVVSNLSSSPQPSSTATKPRSRLTEFVQHRQRGRIGPVVGGRHGPALPAHCS